VTEVIAKRPIFGLIACAARNWSADAASTTGAALAFYCAFSLAPLLVILLTIAGWIVGEQAAWGRVGSQLTALFGPATAKIILDAVESSQRTQPSAYGAAASFAALLLWLYYTAQIFLFGAEFTACMAGTRDRQAEKEQKVLSRERHDAHRRAR
jgi:uncharacterized BrkB/YihY/UPF0761 family membrane protein